MNLRPCLAALLAAAPLAAQEPPRDTLKLSGTIGFVQTSGNTDLVTLNVGQELSYRAERVGLRQSFSTVYGRSEGETNASSWRAGVRGDYRFSRAVAVFVRLSYDRDRFAGISRRLEEGAGFAVTALQRPRDLLELEAGLDLVQERSTLGTGEDFVAGRGAVRYTRRFSDADQPYFQQSFELLPNLESTDDFRFNSESALVAPLSRQLALKVSYVIRLDNQPEPGFEKTDRVLTSALQITL